MSTGKRLAKRSILGTRFGQISQCGPTFTVLVNVLFMLEALISLRNLNEDLWTQMSVQNTHVINLNTQVKILISDTVGNVI